MSKIEERKNKTKSKNDKNKKRYSSTKRDSSNELNFFDYLYQDKDDEYKLISQKEKEREKKLKEYINPAKLIEQLKKEHEDTKILLQKLTSHKKTNRDFVQEMEKEKEIKKRHEGRKNFLSQKKLEKEIYKQNIIYDEKNIKRANKMNKKINSKVFQYFNDKENELDFVKKLNLLKDVYNDDLENVEQDIYKNRNDIKYIKSQQENKIKIEQRKKLEEERKNHLKKMEKDNLKYQRLVQNNFKIEKNKPKNNLNNLFKEEKLINANKSSPNDLINNNTNEQKNDLISKKFEKTTKDDVKLRIKSGICQLPRENDNLNFKAHDELNNILKKDIERTKKLEKLLLFKKKYKYFDISSYIQTGKMNEIKNAKTVRIKHEDITLTNFSPGFKLNFEIGKNKSDDIIVYRNYLQACKYNNSEHIQAYLLLAKNDIEVWTMVNERDEYGRNGLMYLLIHNNINMIKLTLLSGVTLDTKSDIFGRNLIHYCCTNNINSEMMDIICHCIDFKNFAELCKYVDKCIPIDNNNIEEINTYSQEYQLQCEQKINDFDNMIEIKEKILIEKGIIKIEKEDDDYYIDYNKKEKNNFIEVKREIINPYEDIHKEDIHISHIINMPDIEGNYPIHYLIKYKNKDSFKKMEILVYFHAKVDSLNSNNQRAIEITNDKQIQQFLLKQEENMASKESKNKSFKNTKKENNDINKKEKQNNLNKSNITKFNMSQTVIDIDNIKYYTPEKINSFFIGVERNNYLILSVIQQNFELFKFLLKEKKAKADYINENGYSVLNFIIQKRLWNYFSFLFNLPGKEQIDTTEKIYNSLKKMEKYNKNNIKNNKNELTYTGAALSIINNMSKMNNNILSLSIDELNDIYFLKSLLILYDNYINHFVINQEKDLLNNKEKYQQEQDKIEFNFLNKLFNMEFGRNKETLLIKSIKQNNLEMFKYLLNDICFNNKKVKLNIHKVDANGQNVLHYAVKLKQKETTLYLVKYDADFNILKTKQDIKGNTPKDLDKTKSLEKELYTIWDAAKDNNIDMMNLLLKDLFYYTKNEQTKFKGNTPLHLAVKNRADKAVLFLILNEADKDIKNNEGLNALEYLNKEKNVDPMWIKTVQKIYDKKIVNYIQLESCNFEKIVKNEEDIKFSEKVDIVNGNIENIYNKKKKINSNDIDKLSRGILTNSKLSDILYIIKKNIKDNNLDINDLIKNYDKSSNGIIGNNDFNEFIISLNIPEINIEDINFLKKFLEKDENNNIIYKKFIMIIKD